MPDAPESTASIFRRWSERFPEAVPCEHGDKYPRLLTWNSPAYGDGPQFENASISEPDALRRILWACVGWCGKNNYTICRAGDYTTIAFHWVPNQHGSCTDPRPAEAAMLAMLALPEEKP